MARSTKTLTIGKSEYKLMTLGAVKGAELWLDLLRIVATPIETLTKAEGVDEAAIAGAVASAIRSIDHATASKFYAAFGPVSSVRKPSVEPGEPDRWPTLEGAVFDEHFAGNYIELTEWLVQSVIFNFLGFFADGSLGNLVGRFRAASTTTTASLNSSTT